MSTYYMLEYRRGERKELTHDKFEFNTLVKGAVNSESTFLWSRNYKLFVCETTCREIMLDNLQGLTGSGVHDKNNPDNITYGFRMTGEMPTKVSKLIRQDENPNQYFTPLVEQLLGFKATIRAGEFITKPPVGRFSFGRMEIELEDREIPTNGYVDVFINSWEFPQDTFGDMKLSALLGLLREPYIVQRILSGQIQDKASLAKVMVNLAHKRLNREDTSYIDTDYFSNLSGTTYKEARDRWASMLSDEMNGDGSDYMSLTYLAIFFYAYSSGKFANAVNGFVADYDDDEHVNGPVSFVDENVELVKQQIQEMKDAVNMPKKLKDIVGGSRFWENTYSARVIKDLWL